MPGTTRQVRTARTAPTAPIPRTARTGRTARTARIAAGVVLGLVTVFGPTQRAVAITWSQAEVAVAVPSDAPHDGLAGGVVDADTAGSQPAATGPSPVLLLIAALGILIGVLIVTRSRRGPDG